MYVDCAVCGSYEIGPKLYDELLPLPDSDWRIERVRAEIDQIAEPKMIWKGVSNIPVVDPVGADKPTKMRKGFLRAKAEGKTVSAGVIFYNGELKEDGGT